MNGPAGQEPAVLSGPFEIRLPGLCRTMRSRYLAMLGTERTKPMEPPIGVLSRNTPVWQIGAWLSAASLAWLERKCGYRL